MYKCIQWTPIIVYLISLLKDINSAWKVFIYKLDNVFVLQTMDIVPSKIQWLQHLMDKI